MEKSFPTTRRPRQRLLVFARLPEPGRVKSRIAAEIGTDRACVVYSAMLSDLLDAIGGSDAKTEVEVLWSADEEVDGARLREAFGDRELARQCGSDLGERLVVAFAERIMFHLAEKIVAIGSDDPDLSRADVECAFRLLDSVDWTIGPATDGGYYLIGCRGGSFDPAVFRGIPWGTADVFSSTLEIIRARLASVAILPPRTDLDRLADLRAFARNRASRRVGKLLSEWGLTR
jgi:uncharacterized protein